MKNFHLVHRGRSLFSIVSLSFFLSACGSGSGPDGFVSGIHLDSYESGGEKFLEVNTELNLGSVSLPSISYPILKDIVGNTVGTLELRSNFSGSNEIAFNLNIDQALKGKLTIDDRLPNGNKIPVGGLNGVDVYSFDLKNSKSKVYLAISQGVAMAGVAINIKELEKLGDEIGSINFFPRFEKDQVEGVAGIYTSPQANKSGLAIFVNIKSLNLGTSSFQVETLAVKTNSRNFRPSSKALYYDSEPRSRTKRKILRELYKLNRKKSKLRVR